MACSLLQISVEVPCFVQHALHVLLTKAVFAFALFAFTDVPAIHEYFNELFGPNEVN